MSVPRNRDKARFLQGGDSKGVSPLVVPKDGGFKGGNLRASNSELVSSLNE